MTDLFWLTKEQEKIYLTIIIKIRVITMTANILKDDNHPSKALFSDSVEPLKIILNNLDSSIYITDMKLYEILFMNDHMKKLFKEDLTGGICWKSFHEGLEKPCDFCTNNKLIDTDWNPTGPYVWEFFNKKLKRWYELHDQAIPWIDDRLVRMTISTDITGRKRTEQALKESHDTLEKRVIERTSELKDMNGALKILLKRRETENNDIEESIFANFKLRLSPTIERLKNNLPQKQQLIVTLLESEIEDIISPFSKKLSDPMLNLTPMEIQIASMIKLGKSNKDISNILNRSVYTISNHRNNMRKKLNLQNKSINLRTFLTTC